MSGRRKLEILEKICLEVMKMSITEKERDNIELLRIL